MEQPKEMTVCNLKVLLMPNGEVLFRGQHLGWMKHDAMGMEDYLSELDPGLTKLQAETEELGRNHVESLRSNSRLRKALVRAAEENWQSQVVDCDMVDSTLEEYGNKGEWLAQHIAEWLSPNEDVNATIDEFVEEIKLTGENKEAEQNRT